MTARYSVVALNNTRTQSIAKLEFYSIGCVVRYPQALFGVCEYFFVEYHHAVLFLSVIQSSVLRKEKWFTLMKRHILGAVKNGVI